jgi:predicted KAP-like P-loop ATPase
LFRKIKPRRRTGTELKAEIDSALRAAKAKFIVMIDDIDRLNTAEIRQVFQLVKLNANFSNTVFLLAFDNERIAAALEDIAPGPISEYLEKIVQVAFTLPPIAESTLTSIILSNVNEIIPNWQIGDPNQQRFGNMFHSGFRQSFRTIRDVNRYFNLLRFALSLVGNDTNFIDLAGMQALSLFHPGVYSEVQNNPDLFVGTGDRDAEEKKKLKIEYDRIFSNQPKHAYSLCVFMFPKMTSVANHLGYSYDSTFEPAWRRDKRVASRKYFPYYFYLAVPDTEVSQIELGRALDTATAVTAFVKTLAGFKGAGKIAAFIDTLRDSLTRLSQQQLTVILGSVFVFGDEVDTQGSGGTYGILSDHIQFATWLPFDIIDLLQNDRFSKVTEALRNGIAPFTISNFVALCEQMLSPTDTSGGQQKYSDLTPEIVVEMKQAALSAIHAAALDGRLAAAPELPRILIVWARWAGIEGPKAWVGPTFLTDTQHAADYVSKFLNLASSFGLEDKVARIRWTLNFGLLCEFANVETLSTLLQADPGADLTERQRLARDEFRKAKEKYDQGANPDSLP